MTAPEIDDRAREYVRVLDDLNERESREAYMRAIITRLLKIGAGAEMVTFNNPSYAGWLAGRRA